jgi:hypothetical protein
MSTKQELAAQYAARLSQALRLDEATGHVKTAHRASSRENAIRDVVREVDGLSYERTGLKLSTEEKYEFYGLIASKLGVPAGQWGMIKESSIAQALSFEQLLMMLMQKVTYV